MKPIEPMGPDCYYLLTLFVLSYVVRLTTSLVLPRLLAILAPAYIGREGALISGEAIVVGPGLDIKCSRFWYRHVSGVMCDFQAASTSESPVS